MVRSRLRMLSKRLFDYAVDVWIGVCYGIMWGFGVCVIMGIGQG